MKLLDRYILWLFVKNYLISLTVLIGLYVVMDMVFEFDKIVSVNQGTDTPGGLAGVWAVVRDVADYYFYQSFLIFTQMSGIIPVVAAAFTLLRLSRFNELVATLAAGVPILRATVPIIAATVLLNGLLYADQEYVLPRMIPKLVRKQSDMHKGPADRQYAIAPMPAGDHAELLSATYDPATRTMADVDVVWRDPTDRPIGHLRADDARWDPAANHWRLLNGRFTSDLAPGAPPAAEEPRLTYDGVSPDDIALYHDRKSGLVELLSTARLNELIARPKSYGGAAGIGSLYRIKYLRLAQPFMNLVLLLLTIPAVTTFDPKALKPAATKCLTLMGLSMGSVFLCQQIAGQPPLGPQWVGAWPALMSWVPIVLWLPVAVVLMERVRT